MIRYTLRHEINDTSKVVVNLLSVNFVPSLIFCALILYRRYSLLSNSRGGGGGGTKVLGFVVVNFQFWT